MRHRPRVGVRFAGFGVILMVSAWAASWSATCEAVEAGEAPLPAPEGLLAAQERLLMMLEQARREPNRPMLKQVAESALASFRRAGVSEALLTEEAARASVGRAMRAELAKERGLRAAMVAARANRCGIPREEILPARNDAEDKDAVRLLEQLVAADREAADAAFERLRAMAMGGPVTAATIRVFRQTQDSDLKARLVRLLKFDIDPAVDDLIQELLQSTSPTDLGYGGELLSCARTEELVAAVAKVYDKLPRAARSDAMDLLRGYRHRADVQASFIRALETADDAVFAMQVATQIPLAEEGRTARFVEIARGKGRFHSAARCAAAETLWQVCGESETALSALLAILADGADAVEVRLAALAALERGAAYAKVRVGPGWVNDLRAKLQALLQTQADDPGVRPALEKAIVSLAQMTSPRAGVEDALKRNAESEKQFRTNLARVEELLKSSDLPPAERAKMEAARKWLMHAIAQHVLIQIINGQRGSKAEGNSEIARIDEALKQDLQEELREKLQQARSKLLDEAKRLE